MAISIGQDGVFHPQTEGELIDLVKKARAEHKQLRVLGSTHSVWKAIVTDHFAGPDTPHSEIAIVLDRYAKISPPVDDPSHPGMKLVEVQAGCHLGACPHRMTEGRIDPAAPGDFEADDTDPSPWHDGTWEASLNSKLHHEWKLALSDLGGISHQTVAGFISTGSSGGTTKWSVHSAIAKLRVIDGDGNVKDLTPASAGDDGEWFRAAGIGMGLCGVISAVTFRCEPAYDIIGTETISEAGQCDVLDFYDDRPHSGLPNLEKFLVETDYSRLMWWPQRDFDRLVVWQAKRAPFDPELEVIPYKEIATLPVLSQVAASVIYTILGNIDDPARAIAAIAPVRAHPAVKASGKSFGKQLRAGINPPPDPDFSYQDQHILPWLTALYEKLMGERHDPITLAAGWIPLVEFLVTGSDELIAIALKLPILAPILKLLGSCVPETIGTILGIFVNTGTAGAPATQKFQDRWLLGLPMDNQMDDLLMPTWFTELWIPFLPGDGTVRKVVSALRKVFDADDTAKGCYAATGPYSYELYAAKADDTFYLSPATGTKNVFRVDVFWFGRNTGNPVTDTYPKFWEALEPFSYRLHWGKFLTPPDPPKLTARYPDFAKWKAVRDRVDPGNVFLTKYWKDHLGI
ncbi:hypothetical protein BH09MYX1_BH09MYX1_58950 [soil metagenome]